MSEDAQNQTKVAAVFRDAVDVITTAGFDFAVGGGISTRHWRGSDEPAGDIDLVIREEDATAILEVLGESGYEAVEMERSWLHKAKKDGVWVDLMFELKNGVRIDDAFLSRRTPAEIFGTMAPVMAAEDQVASLAATIARDTVGAHWYDIVDIMANNDLDWDYVVERSRRIPLRMLSAVAFALDEKVPVAKGVMRRLTELVDSADDGG